MTSYPGSSKTLLFDLCQLISGYFGINYFIGGLSPTNDHTHTQTKTLEFCMVIYFLSDQAKFVVQTYNSANANYFAFFITLINKLQIHMN